MDRIPGKTRVFVGSSTEGKPLADQVISELTSHGLSPLAWFDVFKNARPPLQELEHLTLQVDGAILVATSDDQVIVRERNWHQMRDNVLFEYGLFAGALGREKCGLLVPDGVSFRIPSDFLGVACFKKYQTGSTQEGAATIAASLAAAIAVPPREDDVPSRGRRLLRLVGWIRDEVFRLVQDWDGEHGQNVVAERIVAVSAFLQADIDSLGLRSEYDVVERLILKAADELPRLDRRHLHGDMHEALRALVHGVRPNLDVWHGLLNFMDRDELFRDRHVADCPQCEYWWRRTRSYPYYPYESDYWPYRRDLPFCGPLAWAAGAAEAAAVFEEAVHRANPLGPLKDWSMRFGPGLNESIVAFERRLHEVIFGAL
jgi:Predicted nucleotide-binding protein containing TIR-like domain